MSLKYFHDIPLNAWQTNNCCPGGWGNIWTDPWQQNVIVVDSLISIQSNDSISICVGPAGGIDTSDLNIQINNSIGSLDFSWIASPSGDQFFTTNPSGIDQNDNEIQLIVTDLATGCSATKNNLFINSSNKS